MDSWVDDGLNSNQRAEVSTILEFIQNLDFTFRLLLMRSMIGITNYLLISLERKYQDIINAVR